jgi:DNA-binding transcriptional MocR family regulator
MLERLAHETPDCIRVEPDPAGMSLVGWLPTGVSDVHLAEELAATKIYSPPLSHFAIEPQPRGALLLGYTGFAPHQIKFGSRALGSTVREVLRGRQFAAPLFSPLTVRRAGSGNGATVTSISGLRRDA